MKNFIYTLLFTLLTVAGFSQRTLPDTTSLKAVQSTFNGAAAVISTTQYQGMYIATNVAQTPNASTIFQSTVNPSFYWVKLQDSLKADLGSSGSYTAGYGLNLNSTEFEVDSTTMVSLWYLQNNYTPTADSTWRVISVNDYINIGNSGWVINGGTGDQLTIGSPGTTNMLLFDESGDYAEFNVVTTINADAFVIGALDVSSTLDVGGTITLENNGTYSTGSGYHVFGALDIRAAYSEQTFSVFNADNSNFYFQSRDNDDNSMYTVFSLNSASVPFAQMNNARFGRIGGTAYATVDVNNSTNGTVSTLDFNNTASRTYTFPNSSGTIALTSNITNLTAGTNITIVGDSINLDNKIPRTTVAKTANDTVSAADKNLVWVHTGTSLITIYLPTGSPFTAYDDALYLESPGADTIVVMPLAGATLNEAGGSITSDTIFPGQGNFVYQTSDDTWNIFKGATTTGGGVTPDSTWNSITVTNLATIDSLKVSGGYLSLDATAGYYGNGIDYVGGEIRIKQSGDVIAQFDASGINFNKAITGNSAWTTTGALTALDLTITGGQKIDLNGGSNDNIYSTGSGQIRMDVANNLRVRIDNSLFEYRGTQFKLLGNEINVSAADGAFLMDSAFYVSPDSSLHMNNWDTTTITTSITITGDMFGKRHYISNDATLTFNTSTKTGLEFGDRIWIYRIGAPTIDLLESGTDLRKGEADGNNKVVLSMVEITYYGGERYEIHGDTD